MTTTFDKRKLRGGACQAMVFVLTQALVVTSVPTQAAPPQEAKQAVEERAPEKPAPQPPVTKVKVNKTRPKVDPVPQTPVFSNPPKDQDFFRARVFAEPFVPIGQTTVEENRAFAQALLAYHGGKDNENVGPLGLFLNNYPNTAWRVSLLTNMGIHYHRTGYFTAAIETLTEAWNLGKESKERYPSAIADRALGELLDVHTKFGQVDELERLNVQVKGRDLHGDVVEKVSNARRAIYVMREKHHEAIASAAVAVNQYLSLGKPGYKQHPDLADFHAKPEGVSLAEMLELTQRTGLKMEMVQRPSGRTDVVVPSIVHLKQKHFAALVKEQNGRFLFSDPILGSNDVWMSRAALQQEASGYFLVPEGKAPDGWSRPRTSDVEKVRGKCFAWLQGFEQWFFGCGGNGCPPMATYRFDTFLAALQIADTPLRYSPPRGAAVEFSVGYHHRQAYQPGIFTFSNLGPRWGFSWLSYVEDDPNNLSGPVYAFVRAGGRETYSGPTGNNYPPHLHSRAVVVRSSSSPITYERRLADGSVEVFSQSDGAVSPRRVFLTQIRDPEGNAHTLTYDSNLRVTSVTDSLSQVTTLTYDLQTDPLKVTKVTDPFGRVAKLEYDAAGALTRITDVIGIVSEIEYAGTDFIRALTTPYGTTSFSFAAPQSEAGVYYADRWLEATDPLGGKERVEFRWSTISLPGSDPSNTVPTGFSNNTDLNIWNSYYWDKRAMTLHPGDYTKAQTWRWLAMKFGTVTGAAHSEKMPLENRVWHEQVGESIVNQSGPVGRPARTGRVLDDGSSQIYRYEYNSKGSKTRETDPLGRETVYEYETNEIDLLRIKQKNGSNYDLLSSATYNSQHLPLTKTDAAGEITSYTYNSAGQLLTIVTPPRGGLTVAQRTTTYSYNTNGYLQSITGPVSGATTSFTYDGYGRVRTTTDSDSYTLTYDYDALDRVTKVTYPDGTYEEAVYNRLDAEKRRDRLGRWSAIFYDASRRPVSTRDPLGRTTTQQWCTCGSLDKLVDANTNATTWERDLQGRVTREIRPDSSAWEYTYENTTSRLTQRKDPKDQITAYQYFLDDTPKQMSYSGAVVATPTVSFTYDPVYNRRATMTDGVGTTSYAYNAITASPVLGAGELASVDGPLTTDTVAHTYEELGRLASRGLSGFTSSFSYDALGRLTTVASPVGNFAYTHDGTTPRPLTLTYPNNQVTRYSYFPNTGDHRLQQIKHLAPGGATIAKHDYTYSVVGNVATWTQQVGASTPKVYTLGYDAADQLTTAKVTGPSPLPVPSRFAYAYDASGNRTAEQLDDAVMGAGYNSRNQLTSLQPGGALLFRGTLNEAASVTIQGKPAQVAADNSFAGPAQVPSGTSNVAVAATDPSGNTRTNTYQVTQGGSTTTYTYDANGNLTGDGTKTFEWDAENRLTAVKQGAATLVSFAYDGEGRRVQKVAGGVTTSYVYDGDGVIEERLSTGGTLKYVRGPRIDQHWAMRDGGGVVSYFLADHLGSVVQTTSAAGAVTLAREYDPFGTQLSGASQSGYAYTGREWDAEAGLAYHRARYYDPKIGRFISEDPIAFDGGDNFYAYVMNNPVAKTDPLGLFCVALPDETTPWEEVSRGGGRWFLVGLRKSAWPGGNLLCVYSRRSWDIVMERRVRSREVCIDDCIIPYVVTGPRACPVAC